MVVRRHHPGTGAWTFTDAAFAQRARECPFQPSASITNGLVPVPDRGAAALRVYSLFFAGIRNRSGLASDLTISCSDANYYNGTRA